jgi:hypothetical protein
MTRSSVLLCVLLLTVGQRATAQSADELAGTWALEVEGRNLVVLTLAPGPEGLKGTLQWPAGIIWSPAPSGMVISRVQGAVFSASIREVRAESSGRVIAYETPDGVSNESILRLDDVNRLSFDLVAESPGFARVTFVRVESSAVVATDWDKEARYYVRDPAPPPNTEMAAIFAADQADRQQLGTIDWAVVGPRDEARRTRVRQMLDEGLLRAADDYYYAALVFQHGEAPEDFLLAHALAMTAQAAGRPDAAWAAAATLDRFLHTVDRAQIFGTQYVNGEPGDPLTQGKYDAALIPDSLRRALGVPTLEQQELQRREMEKQRQAR